MQAARTANSQEAFEDEAIGVAEEAAVQEDTAPVETTTREHEPKPSEEISEPPIGSEEDSGWPPLDDGVESEPEAEVETEVPEGPVIKRAEDKRASRQKPSLSTAAKKKSNGDKATKKSVDVKAAKGKPAPAPKAKKARKSPPVEQDALDDAFSGVEVRGGGDKLTLPFSIGYVAAIAVCTMAGYGLSDLAKSFIMSIGG